MRKFLLILLPFILLACVTNKYKFYEEVNAEIIGNTSSCIGLKFDLYGYQILEDVCELNGAEVAYFAGQQTIPILVSVQGDDTDGGDRLFMTIEHKGKMLLKDKRMEGISMTAFYEKRSEISSFKWYVFKEVEYSDGITPEALKKKLAEDGKESSDEVEVKAGNEKPQPEKRKTL